MDRDLRGGIFETAGYGVAALFASLDGIWRHASPPATGPRRNPEDQCCYQNMHRSGCQTLVITPVRWAIAMSAPGGSGGVMGDSKR